jgi:hypothetical protein
MAEFVYTWAIRRSAVRETAYAGQPVERRTDEGPTPESIAHAKAARERERAAFTRDTGVWLKPNGQMLHRLQGCGLDAVQTPRVFDESGLVGRLCDAAPVRAVRPVVH